MTAEGQAIAGLLAALLPALDLLGHAACHVAPDTLAPLAEAAAPHARALKATPPLPDRLGPARDCLAGSVAAAIQALDGLRDAVADEVPMRAAYAALRALPRAEDALYPLAAFLPAVSRHFLDPPQREDAALAARLAAVPPAREGTGVMHLGGPPGTRGTASLYIPEWIDLTQPAPLLVVLHGGSGTGPHVLWSVLRAARARGVVVIAPTSTGRTWNLHAPDRDLAHIDAWVREVAARLPLRDDRRLLAGMSDGGTFALLAALRGAPGFTHVAPVAASFSAAMMAFAAQARLRGLPIRLVHGVRDWMFPIAMAREAARCLAEAGAAVELHEIADLAHAWPREEAGPMLDWFLG